jgi:sugar phosphate isomerase/epimerase
MIVNIHLSDYKMNFLNNPLMLTYGTHLSLGKGRLPIIQFLKILKDTRYNGIITMEINATLPEILRSARIIKSTM